MTFVLMVAIWEMFVPLGRLLGRYMADHPKTIWAYSINVGGSLAGIWFFVFLSAWEMPPFVWLICAGLLLSVFFGQNFDRKINWEFGDVSDRGCLLRRQGAWRQGNCLVPVPKTFLCRA